ncbi:MAG: polysaccharide biosynthesis protein [Phycisphaeraceae bacterium]|nr:polysaccharide biosynthesis protein [Phycisphaeraceae bacterium]
MSDQRHPTRVRALLIGPRALLRRLEHQLDLMPARPVTIGWVLTDPADAAPPAPRADDGARTPGPAGDDDGPVLGSIDRLEAITAQVAPALALVTMSARLTDLVAQIRTRLRRLGIPDRFVPTLEDLVAGIGPRTHIDVDPRSLTGRTPRLPDEARIRSVVAGRRVLITGAGGSIGAELARIVAAHAPAGLLLVERSENALFEIDRQVARRHPDLPRCPLLHDVVDPDATLEHFRRLRPEIIFHAAAHKHVPMMELHPAAAIDNNLFGTRSVIDAAQAVGAERFVMISTDKAVHPRSIMGATKRLAELYVQHAGRTGGPRTSIVRFGNVLGSAGSVLETWQRQIADGGPVTVTDPRMTRYFMTIPEAATLVIESASLADEQPGETAVYLLDMGDPVRIVDLAERFIRAHGLDPALPGSPCASPAAMPIRFTGIRPGEKLFEELTFDAESMRPTAHRFIHAWNVPAAEPGLIRDALLELAPEHRPNDPRDIAARLRRLLPEMSIARPVAAAGGPAPQAGTPARLTRTPR